jgi:hypothetical protein
MPQPKCVGDAACFCLLNINRYGLKVVVKLGKVIPEDSIPEETRKVLRQSSIAGWYV